MWRKGEIGKETKVGGVYMCVSGVPVVLLLIKLSSFLVREVFRTREVSVIHDIVLYGVQDG